MNPIAAGLFRQASRDDVIPLSSPIMTKSGQLISEIPISKGQNIVISVGGYNRYGHPYEFSVICICSSISVTSRLPSVWGEDANEWNPLRFLDAPKDKQISIGVYANL